MTPIGKLVVAAPFVALMGGCAGGLPEVPADLVAELGEVVVEDSLQNTAPGWAVSGTARLVDIPRYSAMQAQLEAAGLTPGPHAWHIHTGSCGNPGAVVVPFTAIGTQAALDEPLVADENGEAAEDAVVPPERLTQAQVLAGDYSLHIHNAAGPDPGRSIACADF